MIFERLINVSLNKNKNIWSIRVRVYRSLQSRILISIKFTHKINNDYDTSSGGKRTSSYSIILTLLEFISKLYLRRYYSSENLIFFRVSCNWMTSTDLVSGNLESHQDIRVDISKWQLLYEMWIMNEMIDSIRLNVLRMNRYVSI